MSRVFQISLQLEMGRLPLSFVYHWHILLSYVHVVTLIVKTSQQRIYYGQAKILYCIAIRNYARSQYVRTSDQTL
jgi:hypothetical protein